MVQFFGIGKSDVRPIDMATAKKLLVSCDGKEQLAITIGLNSGISFAELMAIAKAHINYSTNTISIISNNKSRVVYLTPTAMNHIKRIMLKQNGGMDYVFQYTEQTFKPVLRKWSDLAGFEITWVMIRHTYAQLAKEAGLPVKLVAHNIGASEKEVDMHFQLTPQTIAVLLQNKVIV